MMTSYVLRNTIIAACTVATAAMLGAQGSQPPLLQGSELEHFLKTADITHIENTDRGVTGSKRVTLEHDALTQFAVFKTIDAFLSGQTTQRSGTTAADPHDSWKTEVAAYELDKMIGLGMVPATVERRHGRELGSMQWWVENTMVERDRIEEGIRPPDPAGWTEQTYTIWLFDNLIYNVDRNLDNMLVTEDWRVYLIDHSRSFRSVTELQRPMLRFSKSLLDAIGKLDEVSLKERLGRYLTTAQIRALLERRDRILERARDRIAESGADNVLYN